MKTKAFFLMATACCCLWITARPQTPVTKKILFSIQPGESIVYSESCLEMNNSGGQVYLVTQKNELFYEYVNGQRKGPFQREKFLPKDCDGRYLNDCSAYVPEEPEIMENYMEYTDEGKFKIRFNNKSYGPFSMIYRFYISPDKSSFFATVDDDDASYLISSNKPAKPLNGEGEYLHVSKSGKQVLAVCREKEAIQKEMENIDFANMSQEELMKLAQKIEEQQKNQGQPKAFIHTADGKTFGPFPADDMFDSNPAFCLTGGDNWYMIFDNTLYINGIKIKQFTYEEISLSTCSVWLSPDGKNYAVAGYDKIIFSDGVIGPAPVVMDYEINGGKTVLKWIALENGKDVVDCTKTL